MRRNALLPVTRPPADRDDDVRSAGPGRMWMNEADVPTERAQRARTHGFRKRMSTKSGRAVIKARRAKGRHRLAG